MIIIGRLYKLYIDALLNKYRGVRSPVRHHIIPKSMGGSGRRDNLCPCDEHEHIILHKLLYRYNKTIRVRTMISSVMVLANEETHDNMSEAMRLRWKDPEYRSYMCDLHRRENLSEGTRKKLSDASRGNTKWLGKHHTEETKRKLSDINKGRYHTEEEKRKISDASRGNTNRRGKHHTEESIKKMRDAHEKEKHLYEKNGVRKMIRPCHATRYGWTRVMDENNE